MENITTLLMLVKQLAVAGVLVVGLSGPVVAGFDEGEAAYERGDYETAYKELLPLALAGDAAAQFNLGLMYDRGHGVPQDDAEAAKWFRKAAEQVDALAKYSLGVMYREGQGVPQDYAKAMKWFRAAAAQGEAKAQFNIGSMFHKSEGVPQDYAEAARWWHKAAEQGDVKAQLSLGTLYVEGLGVPQGYILAHMWLNLAVANGAGEATELRDIVAKLMTPADLSKAQKMTREWKPKK